MAYFICLKAVTKLNSLGCEFCQLVGLFAKFLDVFQWNLVEIYRRGKKTDALWAQRWIEEQLKSFYFEVNCVIDRSLPSIQVYYLETTAGMNYLMVLNLKKPTHYFIEVPNSFPHHVFYFFKWWVYSYDIFESLAELLLAKWHFFSLKGSQEARHKYVLIHCWKQPVTNVQFTTVWETAAKSTSIIHIAIHSTIIISLCGLKK